MKHKLLHQSQDGLRTFVLIFDTGDEAFGLLQEFARAHALDVAHFTAIGALKQVTFAWFDWEKKAYQPIEIDEQVEVLSLIGDIAAKDGEPQVHAHLVVGTSDGTAHGGHLKRAIVRPTLELILTESPVHLRKTIHDASGLALIDLS